MGNGEWGTGNGERGMGNREQESGNDCTAVTGLRIQNAGQRNIDMTARAQGEKICENYEGLKFHLRTAVACPIRVACDNTDSIFSLGAISLFVYPSTNQDSALTRTYWSSGDEAVLIIWGRLQPQHFLILPQIVPFSFPLSTILNSQAGYRCTLVPRLPFPVARCPLPVARYQL